MNSLTIALLLSVVCIATIECCGNVQQQATPDTESTTGGGGRKKRSVFASEVVHVELETTLTSAGESEFQRIEDYLGDSFEDVLVNAHSQVAKSVDGNGVVMKYQLVNVDCGQAQEFAQSVKEFTSFVVGGTVRCNDQTTTI